MDDLTTSSALSSTLRLPILSENLITISASAGDELVHIKRDGTVVVTREGADREASRAFWECIQIDGMNLISQVEKLKRENQDLKRELGNIVETVREAEHQYL